MSRSAVRTVVVDDAPEVRTVVAHHLTFAGGFEVVGEGGNGAEAIALARDLRPDLLLLDVSMPGVDGLAALGGVLEASPATKVVMFSGFAADAVADRALALGAAAFLEKGVELDDLPRQLLAIVDGDSGEPGGMARGVTAGERPPGTTVTETAGATVLSDHVERFHDLFERATVGMATATLTGTVVRSNGALGQLCAVDPVALVGRRYTDLAEPADREALTAAIGEIAEGRRDVADVEHRIQTARGTRWVTSTIAAVREPGAPLYLFLQVQDVTDRHEAADALRRSEERFRLLVDAVADYAIFMLDPSGVIVSWNSGAQRIKGYAAEEAIGRHFGIFYTPDARERRHPEHELDVAAREGRYEEEGWRVRQDGSKFWANVVITALRDADGGLVGFAKVTRDMTEHRLLAEERERAAEELTVANEQLREVAEQRAEFLAVTAHELRNPVVAITGGAQLLRRHWPEMEAVERDEILETLDRSADRLRRLLDDLLTASRLEAGAITLDPAVVPLAPIVREATRPFAIGSSGLEVRCDGELAVVADRGRLVQILANLVANAATYGRPPVVVSAEVAGDGVVIEVRDHGPGVAEALVPQLFTKFTRDRSVPNHGNGLGLYIVRALARSQRGDAWYEPAAPGARFLVRLPAGPAGSPGPSGSSGSGSLS